MIEDAAPNTTIAARLKHWAAVRGDHDAFIFLDSSATETSRVSFAELQARCAGLAGPLAARFAPGARVILALNDKRQFIEIFLAAQMARLVPVPMPVPNFAEGRQRLLGVATACDAAAILSDLSPAPAAESAPWIDPATLTVAADDPPLDDADVPQDGIAFLQYTSGSTGEPKGVIVSHANVAANQRAIAEAFGHDDSSVVASVLPFFHDMGLVGTVLQPLYLGIRCIQISPQAFLRRPVCWLQAISQYRVTTSGGPASLYRHCLDHIGTDELAGLDLGSWRIAFCGAEPIDPRILEDFVGRFSSHRFHRDSFVPCYGMAEVTLMATSHQPGRAYRSIAIDPAAPTADRANAKSVPGQVVVDCGRPVGGMSVTIHGSNGRTLPAGRVGEIRVSGPSVCRGYWRNRDATRRRFVAGGTLRTGDRGFLSDEGTLCITGRIDDLIILGGRNIYPHDLEAAALRADSCLSRAVAFQAPADPSQLVIVAEIAARSPDRSRLRAVAERVRVVLQRELDLTIGDVALVRRGALPFTTSGKPRRGAAAQLWSTGTFEPLFLASDDPVDEVRNPADAADLIAAWLGLDATELAAALPLPRSGMDSLAAAGLAAWLYRRGIAVPVAVLLTATSPDELCDAARSAAPPAAEGHKQPWLNQWQQAFCFAQEANPETLAANVQVAFAVDDPVSSDALADAVRRAIDRYPLLRSAIRRDDTGRLFADPMPINDEWVQVYDGSAWPQVQLEWQLAAFAATRFSLTDGGLFRAMVVRRPHGAILAIVAHHAISDLDGLAIVLRAVAADYAAIDQGQDLAPIVERPINLGIDRGDVPDRAVDLAYWRTMLENRVEDPLAPLAYDRSAPADASGARFDFAIDSATVARLESICRDQGVTLQAGLLAVYGAVLGRYGGTRDFNVGIPVSRRGPGEADIVGCFVNPLPVAFGITADMSFRVLLASVADGLSGASRHGDVPLHDVLALARQAGSETAASLITTMFTLRGLPDGEDAALALPGLGKGARLGPLRLRSLDLGRFQTPYPLSLAMARDGARIVAHLDYRRGAFDEARIGDLANYYVRMLAQLIDDPDAPLIASEPLAPADLARLSAYGTGAVLGTDRVLTDALTDWARSAPANIAVRDVHGVISYGELSQRTADGARYLMAAGISPGDLVALAMAPSRQWVVAAIAIWRAGGTVASLAPDLPRGRLQQIVAQSRPRLVLVDAGATNTDGWDGTPLDVLPEAATSAAQDDAADLPSVELSAIAYVAYTSGTSGRPKAVAITHRALANFVFGQLAYLGPDSIKRVGQFAPPGFDAVYSDLWMALAGGGALCIPHGAARLPGPAMEDFLRAEAITLLTATPSMLAQIDPRHCAHDLKTVISVGEACPADLAGRWSRRARFINGYGPTEACIGTTLGTYADGVVVHAQRIDAGRPLPNYIVRILDRDGRLMPSGVAGEICIGGPGLTAGWLGEPEATAAAFVADRYGEPGARLYRTGDTGYWNESGRLVIAGRNDGQVKRNGVRIEIGEIAAALNRHPRVDSCHIDVRRDDGRPVALHAYVVGPGIETQAELRDWLHEQLPRNMQPDRIVLVATLPLNATGKIDSAALPRPEMALRRDDVETLSTAIATAFGDVLEIDDVARDQSFFDLGGHSLLLHRLQAAIERETGQSLDIMEFFEFPTIALLTERLSKAPADTKPGQRRIAARAADSPIAVIGMAGRFPGADDYAQFWRRLVANDVTIRWFGPAELADANVAAGPKFVPARGVIDGVERFDYDYFRFTLPEAQLLDPQKRLLLELTRQAFDDAALEAAPAEPVGVFMGSSANSYFRHNAVGHTDLLERLGPLKVGIASDPAFIATLIAHRFDLTGPAVTLDTACSTSLSAVHLACQSLRAGDCALALAGGASVDVPLVGGHIFTPGMIASEDGQCRAYCDAATGTVKGMGAGVVLLKPLADALADNDNIHAVILGSALNNDGAERIGFTAPSVTGQSKVIARALEAAGVEPSQIAFVEGHGTGTALGDPIEVAALNRTYAAAAKASIALGSVKANIGHLDAAAGIAGLFKAILAVEHAVIPPHPHAERPNRSIAWDEGPFFLPEHAAQWPEDRGPRHAAISSFGMGGTNVHMVVAQAPDAPVERTERHAALVVLSGSSRASLDASAQALSVAIAQAAPDQADLARTLATGRPTERFRWAEVVENPADLIRKLETCADQAVDCREPRDLELHFPPLGDGWPLADLAALIETDSRLADAVRAATRGAGDTLARIGVRSIGAVPGEPLPDISTYLGSFASAWITTIILQAAGFRPDRLIAHGFGEVAALCSAGALTPQAACDLSVELDRGASVEGVRLCGETDRAGRDPKVYAASTGLEIVDIDASRWSHAAAPATPQTGASAVILRIDATDPGIDRHQTFYPQHGVAGLVELVGRCWRLGAAVDPAGLLRGGRRIALPGRGFDRKLAWLEPISAPPQLSAGLVDRPADVSETLPGSAAVAQIWCDFIGVARIEPDDNFFTLGGDSLLAIAILGELSELWGCELPPDLLHRHPDFTGFVAALPPPPQPQVAAIQSETSACPPSDHLPSGPVPLSSFQLEILLASLGGTTPEALNLCVGLRFDRSPDLARLIAAFSDVLDRHAILRHVVDFATDPPTLRAARGPGEFVIQECFAPRDCWAKEVALQAERPFDLSRDIPIRAVLLRDVEGEACELVVTVHHIAVDGHSLTILLKDLADSYRSPHRGGREAPSYLDWAAASPAQLGTDPDLAPPGVGHVETRLAPDLDRDIATPRRGRMLARGISEQCERDVRALCQREGVTPFGFLLTAFQLLVARRSGDASVRIASPLNLRRTARELAMVGPMVRYAGFSNHFEPASRFIDLVHETHRQAAEHLAAAHGTMVSAGGNADYPLAFAINHPVADTVEFATGLNTSVQLAKRSRPRHDAMIWIDELPGSLRCSLEYDSGLFSERFADDLLDAYVTLIGDLVADPCQLVPSRAAPEAWEPVTASIAKRLRENPEATALIENDSVLSFGELAREIARVGALLADQQLEAQQPVGILLPRGTGSVIASLAVLMAGGCMVPLDPALPAPRLGAMIAAAGVRIVLSDRDGGPVSPVDGVEHIDWTSTPRSMPDIDLPLARIDRGAAAYVMFTSGSTGAPKGVTIEHDALRNRLDWMIGEFVLESKDCIAHKTALGFDVSIWELLVPPMIGARMAIVPQGAERDPSAMCRQLAQAGASVVHFVPSMLEAALHGDAPRIPTMRLCIMSGEAFRPPLLQVLRRWAGPRCEVANLYGPTEAAIDVTCYRCNAHSDDAVIPIGWPITGAEIRILDDRMRPVRDGEIGELFIGGRCLARGYLDPAQTAERFLPDPERPGARLYRSGDLASFREDGAILYRGRADSQIKLNGVRIEPGEIEAVLCASGLALAARVVLEESDGTTPSLVAHVVPTPRADSGVAPEDLPAALRRVAAARLHPAMVPSRIALHDALPLTPSGKADMRQLAAASNGDVAGAGLPNDAELLVAQAWQAVIGGPPPAQNDNFFASGGHSLAAIRLMSEVRRRLGRSPRLDSFMREPTPAALVRSLASLPQADAQGSIVRDRRRAQAVFAMTPLQQAYALGRSDAFGGTATSTNAYLELAAARVDPDRFAAALNRLVQAHDILRAVEAAPGMLHVLKQVPRYEPTILALGDMSPGDADAALAAARERMSLRVFDLQRWPLFDVALAHHGDDRSVVVMVSIDSMIIDGASALLLINDLNRFYADPEATVDSEGPGYRDVSLYLGQEAHGARYMAARDYWLARLKDLPTPPRLPLRSPAGSSGAAFSRQSNTLSNVEWQAFKRLASATGVTPAALLLTVYAEVLALWSGDRHFTVTLAIDRRAALDAAAAAVVGNLSSTLQLEIDTRDCEDGGAIARTIHHQLWQDLEHASFDGIELERQRARRNRGFGRLPAVAFTGLLGLHQRHAAAPGELFDLCRESVGLSRTSQVALDCIIIERPDALAINWDYDAGLYQPGMAEAMFAAFVARLGELATTPAALQGRLASAPPDWRKPGIACSAPACVDRSLVALVRDTVERRGDGIAIVSAGVSLSYHRLWELIGDLTGRLAERGVARGQPIVVECAKGWAQAVGALAVMAYGCPYVPIDAATPIERRRKIRRASAARVALVDAACADDVAATGLATLEIILDGAGGPVRSASPGADDLAYIIFTSGSTGEPKGVAIRHGAAANTICDINARFGVGPNDRVLSVSDFGFDLSVFDIFGMFAAGGTLVYPDPQSPLDAAAWLRTIKQFGITIWNSAPQLAVHLADAGELADAGSGLRLALLSGDWIPLDLAGRMRRLFPGSEIVGLGGATEASIWSIYHRIGDIGPEWRSIPYGRPLCGQDVIVLDQMLRHCPEGVTGDIHIAGYGLADAYWRAPELTAAAFFRHPEWNERLYRTGDLGRYTADGEIEFLGRVDGQVKLHGLRIEVGEVEAAIEGLPEIERAVVQPLRNDFGRTEGLIGYVKPARSPASDQLWKTHSIDRDEAHSRWNRLCDTVQASTLSHSAHTVTDRGWMESLLAGLEEQYRNAVVGLFREFASTREPGSIFSLQGIADARRIAPRYQRWMARAADYLAGRGLLEQVGEARYRPLPALTTPVAEDAETGGSPLLDVLREQMHSAQIYAQDDTARAYQVYYQAAHAAAKTTMAEFVRAARRPLRVLEIGAGYGSITRHLLDLLPAGSRYDFTDISPFFLDLARTEFSDSQVIDFHLFDMDSDPQAQGFQLHGYDCIVSASVLHNARDLPLSLAWLHRLLRPDGLLLMVEETRFFPFFDLGMGLQQGFDEFSDSLRDKHPLLSGTQWREALHAAGFNASAIAGTGESLADTLGFNVILGQAAITARVLDQTGLEERLAAYLPRAAVPKQWVELERFPLRNGKIDRTALPITVWRRRFDPQGAVAPRTENEREVAAIWSQVLDCAGIGVHDNFFDLGGDSLLAARIVAILRDRFGVQLRLQALFDDPTIAATTVQVERLLVPPSDGMRLIEEL